MQDRSHRIPNRTNAPKDRFPVRCDRGVVITVYVESSSLSNSHGSTGDARRRRRNGVPRARECFDRRAQLLAYSRDLRSGDASSWERPGSYADRSPKRKKRRRRWSAARRKLRSLFGQMCRFRTRPRSKHGYERVDPPQAGDKRGFPFRVKLKINLRDLLSGCSRSSVR